MVHHISRSLKRQRKIEEWEARIEKLHKKYPRLEEISKLFAQIALELGLLELGKSGESGMSREELLNAQKALQLEKKKILEEHHLPENIYDVWWDCELCQDTGFRDIGVKCSCLIKEELASRCQLSGLSPEQKQQTFATFSLEWYQEKARFQDIVRDCWGFTEKVKQGKSVENLLLYGPVGTGKTHLCSAIANSVLESGISVVYLKISKLLDIMRDYRLSLDKDELKDHNKDLQRLYKVGLLIIDDLGTENSTDFVREQLFTLLDERINYHLPWVISTNLNPNEIGSLYEDRLSDRIMGTSHLLKFTGESVRQLKKLRSLGK